MHWKPIHEAPRDGRLLVLAVSTLGGPRRYVVGKFDLLHRCFMALPVLSSADPMVQLEFDACIELPPFALKREAA
jgi:hypothetical protein